MIIICASCCLLAYLVFIGYLCTRRNKTREPLNTNDVMMRYHKRKKNRERRSKDIEYK